MIYYMQVSTIHFAFIISLKIAQVNVCVKFWLARYCTIRSEFGNYISVQPVQLPVANIAVKDYFYFVG